MSDEPAPRAPDGGLDGAAGASAAAAGASAAAAAGAAGAVEGTAGAVEALDRIEADLARVSAALDRMEDGSYRTCEACGATIREDELLANPLGQHCRSCAESVVKL